MAPQQQQSQIVLFDLPGKASKAWSPNPWKTRFVLNFKGLDYKTEWLEYPDIKPRLEKHLPGREAYTIPTVIMPDGAYVMDSFVIAEAIEKAFPEPSLHLDSPYLERVVGVLKELQAELVPIYFPLVPERVLNEASVPYFTTTRAARAGVPSLDQLARERGGEKAWAAVAPHARKVSDLLREQPQGPFFMGDAPSFADFVWAGLLVFLASIGDDVLQRALEATGDRDLHLKLLEAVKPWSERDDH